MLSDHGHPGVGATTVTGIAFDQLFVPGLSSRAW
jgi:hypothetical protein